MRKISPSKCATVYVFVATLLLIWTELHIYRKDVLVVVLCFSTLCAFIYSKVFSSLILKDPTSLKRFFYGVFTILCTALTVVLLTGVVAGIWIANHSIGNEVSNVWNMMSSVWIMGAALFFTSILFWIAAIVLGCICIYFV